MRSLRNFVAVAVLTFGLFALSASANRNVLNYILQSPSLAQAQAACQTYGFTIVSTIHAPDTYLVQMSSAVPSNVLQQWVKGDPDVTHLQISSIITGDDPLNISTYIPTLPSTQYGNGVLSQLYGPTAWLGYEQQPAIFQTNGNSIVKPNASGQGIIAVIDTGVDPTNSLLAPVLVPGYDFTQNVAGNASELGDVDQSTARILFQSTARILFGYQAVPINSSTTAILDPDTAAALDVQHLPTDFGHGTMVAGLVHLVAPTAQIMPLKAFHADGTADESDVIAAIYYATDHGATVINMSFGFPQISEEMMKAINYATAKGVVCVAAAGNAGQDSLVYPAAFGNVIGVASVSQQDQPSSFTNYGADLVKIAAPGEGLVTTYPGNHYAVVWGTSFSAALVSGAVDLLGQTVNKNISSQLSEADFARALQHADACVTDGSLGGGCLDLKAASQFIKSMNMQASQ